MADKYTGLINQTDTIDVDLLGLDAGILKVYSKEILHEAMPVMRFKQFANVRTELGTKPGQTISFHKFSNLAPGGSVLAEQTEMALTDALSASVINLAVGEHGKALGVTEYLLKSSPLDVLGETATLLGRHYAQSIDDLCREALDPVAGSGGLTNYKYAGNVANAAALTANDIFDTDLVKDAVELLASNNAAELPGGGFVCFAHPHQLRALRDDAAWINASNYGAPGNLFVGEVGKYENVRFIETTQVAYSDTSGNQIVSGADTGRDYTDSNASLNAYHAIFIGKDALGFAEGLPVEMRDNGVMDFGRRHALAWYSILGVGTIEAGHGVVAVSA